MTMVTKKTRTIAAGEFKAKCLALLDEVGELDEEIVITKRGRPVAKLVPVTEERKLHRPSLAHLLKETGDIVAPIDVEWEAMQ
jgi:prevent-host-death family protein